MTRVLGGGTLIFVFCCGALLCFVVCLLVPTTNRGFFVQFCEFSGQSVEVSYVLCVFVEIIADAALLLFFFSKMVIDQMHFHIFVSSSDGSV